MSKLLKKVMQVKKVDLVEVVQQKIGEGDLNKGAMIEEIVDCVIKAIAKAFRKDKRLGLNDSGLFVTMPQRKAITGRNPKTGEAIKIKASKLPSFNRALEFSRPGKNKVTESYHVLPNLKGGWTVKKGRVDHALKLFDNKNEAVKWGLRASKSQGTEFYIHGKDGTIKRKDSFVHDPSPPREKTTS